MFNASFWLAVAFFIFIGLVFKPVSRVIVNALDGRSERIAKELDEALHLKEEAQALLAGYERDQRAASEEIEAILARAHEEAERITSQAKKQLEESVKKRMELAEQKIAQAEANVIQQLRDNAVDITTSAARSLILENLSGELSEEIIKSAISDIDRKLH